MFWIESGVGSPGKAVRIKGRVDGDLTLQPRQGRELEPPVEARVDALVALLDEEVDARSRQRVVDPESDEVALGVEG